MKQPPSSKSVRSLFGTERSRVASTAGAALALLGSIALHACGTSGSGNGAGQSSASTSSPGSGATSSTTGGSAASSKTNGGTSSATSSANGGSAASSASSGANGSSAASTASSSAGGSSAAASSVGDGGSKPDATVSGGGSDAAASACNGTTHSTAAAATGLPDPPAVTLPSGFKIETIASIDAARQLAALPNGDLIVGTSGTNVYLVPNAEGTPGNAVSFATTPESAAQGVAFDPASCTIYVSTQHDIFSIAYTDGQTKGTVGTAIANVRTGNISPNRPSGDTDNHTTTSVAVAGGKLYAGVGSSCNACVETDPTRASVQVMGLDGSGMATRATRFRNAIAVTANPVTGTLWAGGAGQDDLAEGHPFEFIDALTLHSGVADYGWPVCEENHVAYADAGAAGCASTVAPLVELPAYSTIIGATFYPASSSGTYAFPATYQGGLFLAAHGSWHTTSSGAYVSPPRVAFVAMNGDAPQTAVDWTDATKQWTEFVGGYQESNGTTRIGRPTGLAVGPQGSLFVADDSNGAVYRIRPM